MENSIAVRTPAKINLTLDIVGKRTDGYHYMKSIMQSVSIYDTIELRLTDTSTISLECNDLNIPIDKNLAFQAARRFLDVMKLPRQGLHITLKKKIPQQAGLAGGSANAAGVLVGLNQLLKTKLSTKQLCDIGEKLGADVPFCIVGGTALAEGIGEILMPLPNIPDCTFLIAKGEQGIATADAFHDFDRITSTIHPETDNLVAALAVGELAGIASCCKNVLEQAVNLPVVSQLKQIMMDNGALGASMTGSGSAVYGIFSRKKTAVACVDLLKELVSFIEICSPVSHGPEII